MKLGVFTVLLGDMEYPDVAERHSMDSLVSKAVHNSGKYDAKKEAGDE